MSVSIGKDTDPGAVAEAQSPDLPSSQYRERNIKEYLLACGGTKGLTLICKPGLKTAYIEQDQNEKAPTIYIPARDFDQPASEYPQEIANRLMQYGLALHEHGHDRYTDGAYLKEKFDRLPLRNPQEESFYWSLVNSIEDHRIEAALIREEGEWALQRLQFVSKNLLQARIEDVENPHSITWASALKSAAFHYGKGRNQSNVLPVLLDETNSRLQWRSEGDKHLYYWVAPELKSVLDTAAAEPKPKEAVRIELEFVKALDDFLAEISPQSRNQEQEETVGGNSNDKQNDIGGAKDEAEALADNDSSTSSDEALKQDSPAQGSPSDDQSETANEETQSIGHNQSGNGEKTEQESDDDMSPSGNQRSEDQSGQSKSKGQEDAQASSDAASQDSQQHESDSQPDEPSTDGASPQREAGNEDSEKQAASGDSEHESNASPNAMSQKGNNSPQSNSEESSLTEEEVSVREHRQVTAERQKIKRDKEALEREVTRLKQAVGAGEGGVEQFTLLNQTSKETNQETWKRVQSEARQLKSPLKHALQRSQETNEQRGTRVGRFDSKLGYRLATNNLNVNKRVSCGEQKQYTVVIVLDRSASMRGQITDAEAAAGGFAKALEDIGVTVAVIDLYRDTARMVKPFGSPTERAKAGLTNGDVGGTTPLTDALVLSRERVRQGQHYPFMVVISDGLPNEKQTYLNELSGTSFPVVGINITRSTTVDEEFRDCYDVCESTQPETLTKTLSTVAQRVIF